MVFLILTIASLFGLGYMTFFHIQTPVEFHNEPVPTWQDGDNICFTVDYTRYTTAPVKISRTFRDGIMFSTVPTQASGNVLGRQQETICYPIPSTLPNGEYYTETDLEFNIHHFSKRIVTYKSQIFIIQR